MHEHQERPRSSRRPGSAVAAADRARRSSATSRSGDRADALLALQRSAGNAAVLRTLRQRTAEPAIAVQRATTEASSQAGVTTEAATAEAVTPEEIRLLRQYQQQTQDPAVQRLLAELMPLLERVERFRHTELPSGGHTHYDSRTERYTIENSVRAPEAGRVATLVHELTHVAANEAYDADMLNYPVPQLPDAEREELGADEEARQNARIRALGQGERDAFEVHVLHNVRELISLLPTSGLSPERQNEARGKLTAHTAPQAFREYDPVLSSLLVWSDQAGADARSSPFHALLTRLVAQAAEWRSQRHVTPGTYPGETHDSLLAEINAAQWASGSGGARTTPPSAGRGHDQGRLRRGFRRVLDKLSRIFPFRGRHRDQGAGGAA